MKQSMDKWSVILCYLVAACLDIAAFEVLACFKAGSYTYFLAGVICGSIEVFFCEKAKENF
jgi:hypothetical protein